MMSRTLLVSVALCLGASGGVAAQDSRSRLEGSGVCQGIAGSYLAPVAGGRATVISAAPFPGAQALAGPGASTAGHQGPLWSASVAGFAPEVSGCVAFDKDQFTWASDLATYVQYLVREFLSPAQTFDPAIRTLAIGRSTVHLQVARPGVGAAQLSGPEGAMLGYGLRSAAERFFFVPVIIGDGQALLVRILRNHGEPFGDRSSETLGHSLLRAGAMQATATEPMFELVWVVPAH